LNKILQFVSFKDLKNFLPKICSEYFKALNHEYKISNKTIVLTIQGLEKLIVRAIEEPKPNKKIDLIDKYKKMMVFEKHEEKADETISRITSFLEIFYHNLEKNHYNQIIAETFMHFALETLHIFISTPIYKWLLLSYIYFNNLLLENTESEIYSLYNNVRLNSKEQINSVLSFLKEEFFINIKGLEKLHLKLDSQSYLKTFRILKDIFFLCDLLSNQEIKNLRELNVFNYNESQNISQAFLKIFCIRPIKMIKIEISEQMLEINLFKNSILELEFIKICEEKVFSFQMRKIIDNFEIMNFDENVFFTINEMFLKIDSSLAFYLFQNFFNKIAEFRYSFESKPQIKEVISLLFLTNHIISCMIGFSLYNRKWFDFLNKKSQINPEFNGFFIQYIELLLGLDFLPIEDLRDTLTEYKIIFEMLKLEAINKCFSILKTDYQCNFLNKFNILYYLLEKYVENDTFIKSLIEKHLAYFVYNIEKEKNISKFLNKFIGNIINRVVLQIRSIHILENKLQPFKVFQALLLLLENDEQGIMMFHMFCLDVWTTFIKCYDKYYLLSETKFIYLMLTIIKQIMKIIGKTKETFGQNDQENIKFNEINLIRQILLRIKPLIVSKKNEIMVLANEIFKESLIIIHSKF